MNAKILEYRKHGKWHKYNGEALPDTIEAVLVTEQMTMAKLKEYYPEQYKSIKARIVTQPTQEEERTR